MKKISYYVLFIVVIGTIAVFFWAYQRYFEKVKPDMLLFDVDRGSIQEVVRVRGEIVPQKDFDLEFPFSGIIENIFVQEGQDVNAGSPLMKLQTTNFELEVWKLQTELNQAIASLEFQNANLRQAKANTTNAKINLDLVIKEQDTLVENAYRTLVSSNLEAFPINESINDAKPVVSGTYTCNEEGIYTLSIYGSGSVSGYSYVLSGLEDGTYSIYTGSPASFGSCGLFIQFIDGESYRKQDWIITIPNTRSDVYIKNLNAYDDTLNARDVAVENARAELEKKQKIAESNSTEANNIINQITAQEALVKRAEANIQNYKAQIAIIQEKIKKSTIYAPIDVKIVKIELEKSEVFSLGQTAIILSTSDHKIQADISELEIGKIKEDEDNEVSIQLDAFPDIKLKGKIVSIEPKEIIKEGDKYYRANIYMESHVPEVRSGMNADLEILVSFKDDVLKIPEFVVYQREGKKFVTVVDGEKLVEKEIETGISDGELIEITKGLSYGQTVAVSAD